jgi:hypothetical protein
MLKYEVVYSNYEKETGISIVEIASGKYGNFTGKAKLHPEEDLDFISTYFGCQVAERRAYIKLLKAACRDYSSKISALNELECTVKNSKEYDKDNLIARKLRREKFYYSDLLKETKDIIALVEKSIPKMEEQRRAYLARIRKSVTNI